MRFGIFYYGTEVRDRGLGQLSQLLADLGHETMIVSRAPNSDDVVTQFQDAKVIQLPLERGWLSRLKGLPLPFNVFWKIWAEELIEKKRFDAVFVRETPLSNQVIAAAQKFNIPVYLDMRENLSAMYKAGRGKSMMRCITRPIVLLKMYESRVLPRFSHIFTVSDELGEWVSKSYAIPSDKISTLSNFSSQRYLSQAERAMVKAGEIFENRKIIMVHAGYVVENRGLQDILKGLKIIVEKGYQQVNLRVIGQGAYVETLITLSKELGVQNNVEFLPLLPPEDVADALAECHIGICSYLLNEQTHQTLPGKLFEYMAVGLPVVTSARRPVVRIIEQEQCGIIYYSRDPKEIANSILALVTDRKLMQKMSDRSKRAISQRYNPKVNIDVLKKVL